MFSNLGFTQFPLSIPKSSHFYGWSKPSKLAGLFSQPGLPFPSFPSAQEANSESTQSTAVPCGGPVARQAKGFYHLPLFMIFWPDLTRSTWCKILQHDLDVIHVLTWMDMVWHGLYIFWYDLTRLTWFDVTELTKVWLKRQKWGIQIMTVFSWPATMGTD
jgi:hypothetical protein